MNLSWNDLNNLHEAGDYPFRDGTISVTFAEVAIWKQNPGAQFQLMRKHPIQNEFKYVLGKQIEAKPAQSNGANGPEHQAPRHSMETSARVATILIAYDIHPAKGEAYEDLIKAIQSLGTWWHHLETIWIVQCGDTPGEIRDKLRSYMGSDDQLLVIDISGDTAGWVGINDTGSKWLTGNI